MKRGLLTKSNRFSVALLGVMHFLVDFECIMLLNFMAKNYVASYSEIGALVILYNGLAFAFQFVIGGIADLFKLTRKMTFVGCVLVSVGCFIKNPHLLCGIIGVGNACFHIGAGRESLKRGNGKMSLVGKFVAPGCLGVFLAALTYNILILRLYLIPLLILASGVFCMISAEETKYLEEEKTEKIDVPVKNLIAIVSFMFLTVFLRSYMGGFLKYEFKSVKILAFVFVLCVFFGKYFGGVLADKLGVLKSSLITQLLCVLLLTLSVKWQYLAFPAILMFNTTMAVTATLLYNCLPKYGGAMFGLTTFALFLGTISKHIEFGAIPMNYFTVFSLSVISAVLYIAGIKLTEMKKKC